jgi:hypothetical protein
MTTQAQIFNPRVFDDEANLSSVGLITTFQYRFQGKFNKVETLDPQNLEILKCLQKAQWLKKKSHVYISHK